MPVYETYSERKRASERSGTSDIYVYDRLPPFLRRQLKLVFTACIGPWARVSDFSSPPNNNVVWDAISNQMHRTEESFDPSSKGSLPYAECMDYLQNSEDINGVLALIEMCCRYMEYIGERINIHQRGAYGISQDASEGLLEVNIRFRQSAVGYEFVAGQIVQLDSEFIHSEIVKVALTLLQGPIFEDANIEFRKAHGFYRAGDIRDCNTAALRSMESVLKAICHARDWTHEPAAVVEKLIALVRSNGLFPDYLGGSFDQLIGAMKSGLPKVRDKQGGHSAGPEDRPVPDYIGGYALHLAASNIVLLAKAFEALPPK